MQETTMNLSWTKCVGNQWCSLLNVNLEGVYIIWHGGQNPATVYVGQGAIADRLAQHRQDTEILQFTHYGIFVTWAKVDANSRSGIERFLAEKLQPKVGQRYPTVSPIVVNFPW